MEHKLDYLDHDLQGSCVIGSITMPNNRRHVVRVLVPEDEFSLEGFEKAEATCREMLACRVRE